MPGEIGKEGSRRASDGNGMRKNRLLSSSRGVTLIEVMIALVVLLIVFTGLIQAALLSINFNVRNQVRDGAVRIASEAMANLKAQGFNKGSMQPTSGTLPVDFPSDVNPGPTTQISIGNYVQPYEVKYQVHFIDSKNYDEQVTVQVIYTYRTDPKVTYAVNSVVVNPVVLNQ